MTEQKLKEVKVPQVKMEEGTSRELLQQQQREVAKALWTGKLTPAEQSAVNLITTMYSLDPILKQIVVLGGNIYITSGGLKVIANRNKETAIDGIQVIPATEQERKNYGCINNDPSKDEYQHLFKAIVYKKGCSQPFIEWGEADKGNVKLFNADFKSIADMAKTRAVNRALRNAYDIAFTSIEEIGYQPETIIDITAENQEKPEKPKEKKTITPIDIKIHELKKQLNNDTEYYTILKEQFGIEHSTELNTQQKAQFATLLAKKIKEVKNE
ncbi:MAG: hypothetical protein NC833_03130 [Candidatus Omnitrophica bacterium]|nr:hypothetical protein [Candidatus Omnitrophota bacterium]